MGFKKISADYIFPLHTDPIQEGVVVLDEKGTISALAQRQDFEPSEIETYDGFLVPGFVNTHCHLELSHMKGLLPEKTGLVPFIKGILANREASEDVKTAAMLKADKEMFDAGIVAVGDISNVADTFRIKANSKLYYHTFVEIFNLQPALAEETFRQGLEVYHQLTECGLQGSLAPHAPYTVSPQLIRTIDRFNETIDAPCSIHNQETAHENDFFIEGTGDLVQFYQEWGFDISFFEPSGKRSLPSVLPHFSPESRLLLVHNTMTNKADIDFAQAYMKNLCWNFNPNANLYIEDKLPAFEIFSNDHLPCSIGTDSLASNHQLSVLEELKTIEQAAGSIPLDQLLIWSSRNGAQILGIDDKFGSIEPGKRPGLVLIEGVDVAEMRLTEHAHAQRIV